MASVDLGVMEFDHVERINNVDIISLVAWLDTGIRQFSTTTSGSRYDTHPEDINIALNWLNKFTKDFGVFNGEPELFMPKASPKPKVVPLPPTDVNIIQNQFLQHLIYQLSSMRSELLFCESAERLNGFQARQADVVVTPWIEKQRKYIAAAQDELSNPAETWMPEADLQEPPVNAGEPR